jgi:hypothetical protein
MNPKCNFGIELTVVNFYQVRILNLAEILFVANGAKVVDGMFQSTN